MRPGERIGGLDAMRGVAVALVMTHHASPNWMPGAGVVGVNVFFALSGFLITRLLLDEFRSRGRIDLASFFARRAVRLMPALIAMLVVYTAVTLALDPLGQRAMLSHGIFAALTFTSDIPSWKAGADLYHLWTLGVEAQFYLIWPLMLVFALPRGRGTLAVFIVLCTAAALSIATLVWFWEAPDLSYALPTPWLSALVIGGWYACAAPGRERSRLELTLATTLLAVLCMLPLRGHHLTYVMVAPLVALATCQWIVSVVARPVSGIGTTSRLLAALGAVSYAAYIWDYPLTLWCERAFAGTGRLTALPLTIAIALLSRQYIERPAVRIYRTWEARWN